MCEQVCRGGCWSKARARATGDNSCWCMGLPGAPSTESAATSRIPQAEHVSAAFCAGPRGGRARSTFRAQLHHQQHSLGCWERGAITPGAGQRSLCVGSRAGGKCNASSTVSSKLLALYISRLFNLIRAIEVYHYHTSGMARLLHTDSFGYDSIPLCMARGTFLAACPEVRRR